MLPASCLTRMWANGLKFCAKSVSHRTPNASLRKNIAATFFKHSQATSTINRLPVHRTITTRPRKDAILKSESVSPQTLKNDFVRIAKINLLPDEWMMEVRWEDGFEGKYPYIWLRDNCQCSGCFHGTASSRRVLVSDLDIAVIPDSFQLSEDSADLEISWSDEHSGFFTGDWLRDRTFTQDTREKRKVLRKSSPTFWGSDITNSLPTANFNKIMEDEHALLESILKLESFGLLIVHDAPCQRAAIFDITKRLGFIKQTHYGVTFAVVNRVDPNNLAYTSDSLDMHTDLPFMDYAPGIQLLHCISQVPGTGGENDLVDALQVARQLQATEPEKFEILSTILVDYIDHGVEEDGLNFYALTQAPLIRLDRNGDLQGVSLNQMVRDSYFNIPLEKVRDWYDAMLTYYKLLYHPDNVITYKMNAGDILIFDNQRVLHGRKGFVMTEGTRELHGAYWDWDMVRSCRRVLQRKLGLLKSY